jgi:hypothetical protein
MIITATAGGSGQPAKFPATGKKVTQPKNAQTQNRQGQAGGAKK